MIKAWWRAQLNRFRVWDRCCGCNWPVESGDFTLKFRCWRYWVFHRKCFYDWSLSVSCDRVD